MKASKFMEWKLRDYEISINKAIKQHPEYSSLHNKTIRCSLFGNPAELFFIKDDDIKIIGNILFFPKLQISIDNKYKM